MRIITRRRLTATAETQTAMVAAAAQGRSVSGTARLLHVVVALLQPATRLFDPVVALLGAATRLRDTALALLQPVMRLFDTARRLIVLPERSMRRDERKRWFVAEA